MAEVSPNATLDDIVFANRNKAYGAFSLRKGYRADITKSTLIGAALFVFAMFSPALIDAFKGEEEKEEGADELAQEGRDVVSHGDRARKHGQLVAVAVACDEASFRGTGDAGGGAGGEG